MAKKPAKTSAKKPAPGKVAKATKAESPKTAKQAVAPPAAAAAPAKPKPVVPPRPVPAHQQFLDNKGRGGVKPQSMTKARIIRHQGR